jgi:hypothetical protein
MAQGVKVHLFGSLRSFLPGGADSISVECTEPMRLEEIFQRLGIGSSSVQLAMANHRALSFQGTVRPGDRLALFPREYAVFVDWKDFRT